MTGSSSTFSPRVLTCAYNRRRNRFVSPHFETDGTILMNTQTAKPTALSSMKPPRGDLSKISSLESSENVQDWAEKRTYDTASKPSLDNSTDDSCREEEEQPSVFREIADFDDQEDMMVLKRANPVYDVDDEDYMAARAKRQRTSSSSDMVLSWNARVSVDPSGAFCIRLQQ